LHKNLLYHFFKRTSDIILSLLFIVISFPIQVLIFLFLLIELKEFPIFIQKRGITLENKLFNIIKFKTIKTLPESNTNTHNIFLKTRLEKYIGPFSRLLRKTGLDELPQLYNVLSGSMSLVGPRPLMITDLQIMKKQFPNHYHLRSHLNSKPGLSGMWQLFGNREEGIENLIELDYLYEFNRSVILDFKLLLITFSAIIFERNSDAILANKQKQTQRKLPREITISNGKTSIHLFRKGTSRFIKNLKKVESIYSIELPEDYWNTKSSLEKSRKDSKNDNVKIFNINNKSAS
jgi:O-antigen biosynthesis protein WbqP